MGFSLPEEVRLNAEAVFGEDFSDVRIHMLPRAPRAGVQALTSGSNLYFAPGKYDPESEWGLRLLGHELAHVVQQRRGHVRNPYGYGIALVSVPELERDAERMGLAVQRMEKKAKPPKKSTAQQAENDKPNMCFEGVSGTQGEGHFRDHVRGLKGGVWVRQVNDAEVDLLDKIEKYIMEKGESLDVRMDIFVRITKGPCDSCEETLKYFCKKYKNSRLFITYEQSSGYLGEPDPERDLQGYGFGDAISLGSKTWYKILFHNRPQKPPFPGLLDSNGKRAAVDDNIGGWVEYYRSIKCAFKYKNDSAESHFSRILNEKLSINSLFRESNKSSEQNKALLFEWLESDFHYTRRTTLTKKEAARLSNVDAIIPQAYVVRAKAHLYIE